MPSQAVFATTDLTTKVRYVTAWSFAENAATPAAARVVLKDGGSGGPVIVDIALAASDSKSATYPKPLHFPNGLYVHLTSAAGTTAIRGSIQGT